MYTIFVNKCDSFVQFIGSFGFFGSSVFTHGIIGVYRIPKNMVTGLVLGNGERESISQHQCQEIIIPK